MIIILLNKDPAEFCVESLRRMVEGHCRFQFFWKLFIITINCHQDPKFWKLPEIPMHCHCQDQRHSRHPCLEGCGHAGRHQEDLQANKKMQIKSKKDLQANKKRQIKDKKDLQGEVQERARRWPRGARREEVQACGDFFITSHQLGDQSISSPFPRS